jgi:RNA-directed DNA polymerase
MNEGKLMDVSHSTISAKDKSLTNAHFRQKWRKIDWLVVKKSVNKLQVRITKAVKQNNWHLVKRLEHLLVNFYYAKLLAVRKVTRNKGKRTAGIDGNKWLTPESKM